MDEFQTQDIQCGQMLTYHDFFEAFNAISQGYQAVPARYCGVVIGVEIVSKGDRALMASLCAFSRAWAFEESGFNYNELVLMAKLAANMPEFRGKI